MRYSILLSTAATLIVTPGLFAGNTDKNQTTPTFNRDIAPVIYKNCSGCHHEGEVAPFALMSYQDVAKRAAQIAAITQARVMPPWKATPGYGDFANERTLTDQQIATIREWAARGAPEGDAKDKVEPPKFVAGWQGGQPDQILRMSQAFSAPAEGPDQFRCFVIPLGAKEDEYVQGVEFHPGNRKIVHHAIMFLDNSGEARKLETVPGQGYDCVGGPGLAIEGALGGWAPGTLPSNLPDGLSHTVKKGSDLVLQVHYHLDGKAELDQSEIGLRFAKAPPTRGLTLLVIGNQKIDIPEGDDHYVVKASSTLPMDATAIAVFPHAHYLCKDMKVTAHLPDGSTVPMIWIKDWDFNWQGAYGYKAPIKLPRDTRIDMEYTYDNSAANPHNPSNPPKEVRFGEQTTNEMAFAFVSVTVDTPEEVPVFQREARAEFVASMIENGVDESGLDPKSVARLKMLFAAFDKNHNGKIDPDERHAMVEYLANRQQPKQHQEQQQEQH
jgi:hypothetical protein